MWNDADAQKNGLMNEGVIVAQTWDGPPIALKNEGQPVMYRAALEGALAWIDGMSIPTGAENLDQAYAFIQHCYDAEAAGKAIDTHGYNSPVLGAEMYANAQYAKNFADAYPGDALQKLTRGRPSALVRRRPRPVRQQVSERLSQGRASTPGSHSDPGSAPRAGRPRAWPSLPPRGNSLSMVAGSASSSRTFGVQFGGFVAVRDASVRIEPGEFFSFLGPSGCGKTTILRTVSGFLEPSRGVVRINGRDMAAVGPNRRPTALIFQNLAYSH